ncbi:hypothetical protein ACTXMB_14985 [Arthrobacter rhombi]|uniref:hypothetical protein n=1 Tax=Arthrobacter rhombi TaxID=71253 RepID=UPI003FD14B58
MQTITGMATASTIMRRIPVKWTLDPNTHNVTANGAPAGRVYESIPGKLYYFRDAHDAAHGDFWGMFGTAAKAAERGAVRYILKHPKG